MEIRESSFNFSRTRGAGPERAETTIAFPRAVRTAAVGRLGYSATFEDLCRDTVTLRASYQRTLACGTVRPTVSRTATLMTPVTQATAILRGFDVAFSPREDHHLGNLEVRLDASIDRLASRRVIAEATFGLRDWSGDWDDNYEGEIFFTVVAE